MGFPTVICNDMKVLFKCINRQLVNKGGIKCRIPCASTMFRTYSEIDAHLPKYVSEKTKARLKQFDGVSPDYDLIYRAPRSYSFHLLHGTLLSSGIAVPICMYIIAKKNNFVFPITVVNQILIENLWHLSAVLSLISYTMISMFILVNRFPLRLYLRRSTNDYIAAYANPVLPWKMTQVKFKKGDVTRVEESKYIPFQLAYYKIIGCKTIINDEHFLRPVDLDHMLKPGNR